MINIDPFNDSRICVLGIPHLDHTLPLSRIPTYMHSTILKENPNLIELSMHTAGVTFMFQTSASKFTILVDLLRASLMNHMPMTAESGFDLYCIVDGQYHFLDVARASHDAKSYQYTFRLMSDEQIYTYVLYAPLYNGIKNLTFDFEKDACIQRPIDLPKKKILIYGTSITQGACASRPGLSYPARISRMFDFEVINYGFSGNALGEQSMINTIAGIKNLDMIIIDYEANAGAVGLLTKTFEPMIHTLTTHHQNTPILVLGRIPTSLEIYDETLKKRRLYHETFMMDIVKNYPHTHYVSGERLLSLNHQDTTVDGIHLNDVGFEIFTQALLIHIKKLMC